MVGNWLTQLWIRNSCLFHLSEFVDMEQLPRRDKLVILNSWKELEEQEIRSENSDDGRDAQVMRRALEESVEQVGWPSFR